MMMNEYPDDTDLDRIAEWPDDATCLRISNTILNNWEQWEEEAGQQGQLYQDPEAEHEWMLFSVADAIRDGLNQEKGKTE